MECVGGKGSCDMGTGSSEVSDIGNGGAEGIGGERTGIGGGGVGGMGIGVGIVKKRIAEVEGLCGFGGVELFDAVSIANSSNLCRQPISGYDSEQRRQQQSTTTTTNTATTTNDQRQLTTTNHD